MADSKNCATNTLIFLNHFFLKSHLKLNILFYYLPSFVSATADVALLIKSVK